MAIKEGRCPNCGSLLNLDTGMEKGHCLFCDAVFENRRAFEIAQNPKDVTFPNEVQPKYEGPSLEPRGVAGGSGYQAAVQQPKKKAASKPAEPAQETYISKMAVQPDIKLPFKVHLMIAIALVAVVAIFAAVAVPMALRRDRERSAILTALPSVSPITIKADQSAALRGQDNRYLMVAVGESVTPQQATALFKAFCEKRAETAGVDRSQFSQVYGHATLRLAHKDGGYLIDQPSQADLESGAAVKTIA